MIKQIINTVFYSVIVILIISAFVVLGSEEAKGCDSQDDLTEITWRYYKPCMSSGESVNWCKR